MAAWLIASGAMEAAQIHIAVEVPHDPWAEARIERGFTVHSINPKQMDRFCVRFTLGEAQDDSRDANVMASGRASSISSGALHIGMALNRDRRDTSNTQVGLGRRLLKSK
jgi:hypothetical protein